MNGATPHQYARAREIIQVSSRFDFLVHVKVLARLFRGKMLAMLMAR